MTKTNGRWPQNNREQPRKIRNKIDRNGMKNKDDPKKIKNEDDFKKWKKIFTERQPQQQKQIKQP